MLFLKKKIKQLLIKRQRILYEKRVSAQNLTYHEWISQQEKNIKKDNFLLEENGNFLTNDLETVVNDGNKIENERNNSKKAVLCRSFYSFDLSISDGTTITLITLYKGKVSDIAKTLICKQFLDHKNTILVYGDEDIKENDVRENPWFKPDWSPDRFLSCFYFGGIVAVRKDALLDAYAVCKEKDVLNNISYENWEKLYFLLFELLKLHHAFEKGHEKSQIPVCHIPQILFHSKKNGYDQIKDYKLPDEAVREIKEETEQLISIIIPSKDNVDVLFNCLASLIERTVTKYRYEIILVDNGSKEENQIKIRERAEEYGSKRVNVNAGFQKIKYLYEVMEFNFSRMCNKGAEAAEGGILLFLNDDMEIISSGWLDLLAGKAVLPYAGAVGAKLLYPESDKIQHAGITNLRVGPAHKLQFLSDEKVHYFGMNRGVHNMLAVTGACLMVKRKVFSEAGGFYEGLAVAFNDVDLCYTIYEKGYYNIVRNDVILYHHESLSRGKDGESEKKQLRLLKEKDILYERHQDIYGKDPFYHPYLTTDMLESEYSPRYRYQVTLDMPWSVVEKDAGSVKNAKEDQCLVVGMECAMDIYKWQYGVSPEKGKVKVKTEDMGYYFQGYSFVVGSDNACYKKRLLLKNQENGQVWLIPVEDRYRQDIKNNLKDQLNVDLTGFAGKMRKREIPAGVYQFGMLAEDTCSRQKLVNWSNWVIQVEK